MIDYKINMNGSKSLRALIPLPLAHEAARKIHAQL